MSPTRSPQARRERIVNATVSVIRERGLSGAHVTDIAALASTSSGLVLYHFGSLAGALDAAVNSVETAFAERLSEALELEDTPLAKLAAFAHVASEPGPEGNGWRLWLELWSQALQEGNFAMVSNAREQLMRDALRGVIDAGIHGGTMRCADPDACVTNLLATLNGLGVMRALQEAQMSPDRMARMWLEVAHRELVSDNAR